MFKYRSLAALILFMAIMAGCRKEENNDIYLESYRLIRSVTAPNIQMAINIYSTLYPDISEISDNTTYGISIYAIEYKTTFQGIPVIASGLVSIPDKREAFPVISFQNGTNSCHANAPSVNPYNGLYSLLAMMAGNGYIVSIPDYIGFGSSENYLHPYYHTLSSNIVIADMLLAVEELVNNHLTASLNNDLFLMGYSQGGWATMTALKEYENIAPAGLDIVAASCGAGAYDLISFSEEVLGMESYPNPFYFPYFIQGRRANGMMSDPLSLFFKEPYASDIPSLFDGSLCNSGINDELTVTIADLFTASIIDNFSNGSEFALLRDQLTGASVEAWHLTTPLMMAHSTGDESVPYNQAGSFIEAMVGAGTAESDITFIPFEGLLHNDAIVPWGIATLAWFNQF